MHAGYARSPSLGNGSADRTADLVDLQHVRGRATRRARTPPSRPSSPVATSAGAWRPRSISAIISSVSRGARAGERASRPRAARCSRRTPLVGDERVDRARRTLGREQARGPPGLRVARDRHARRASPSRSTAAAWATAARLARVPARRLRGAVVASPRASTASAIFVAAAAASNGYSPIAVSPESMIASAPSSTAFATSVASARVGRGARIIDSSIWVATITGRPAARAARSRSFCSSGICSIGSSTPRSPRATIRASVTLEDRLDVLDRRACVSIFATIGTTRSPISVAQLGACRRDRARTTARRGRRPSSSARARPSRSRSVTAGRPAAPRARSPLDPSGPCRPARTRCSTIAVLDPRDRELDRAVGEQHAVALRAGPRRGPGRSSRCPLGSAARPAAARTAGPARTGTGPGPSVAEPHLGPGQVGEHGERRAVASPPTSRTSPTARA